MISDVTTIAGKAVVDTGSYTYGAAASTANDDVLVVVPGAAMVQTWSQQFQRVWDDKAQFAPVK